MQNAIKKGIRTRLGAVIGQGKVNSYGHYGYTFIQALAHMNARHAEIIADIATMADSAVRSGIYQTPTAEKTRAGLGTVNKFRAELLQQVVAQFVVAEVIGKPELVAGTTDEHDATRLVVTLMGGLSEQVRNAIDSRSGINMEEMLRVVVEVTYAVMIHTARVVRTGAGLKAMAREPHHVAVLEAVEALSIGDPAEAVEATGIEHQPEVVGADFAEAYINGLCRGYKLTDINREW